MKKNDLFVMCQWLDRPCEMSTLWRSCRERSAYVSSDIAGSRNSGLSAMQMVLAHGLLMLVSCTCRICRSEYQSLLQATSCCKEAKMNRRSADSLKTCPQTVKFKTHQLQFGLQKLGVWCKYGHCDLLSETCDCKKF